jgi:putative (di)nucleoside polyphosphate hydrolase
MPRDLPYRDCVGIMVINREGNVFTGRRKAKPRSEEDGSGHLWQMPQGGIDKGEEPEPAARRELWEETGISTVSLLAQAPDWIIYDLPPELLGVALKGKFRGQRQKWFAYRFEGNDSEIAIDPPPGGHVAEFDMWQWRPMAELPQLIVPFKRRAYEQVISVFAHLGA